MRRIVAAAGAAAGAAGFLAALASSAAAVADPAAPPPNPQVARVNSVGDIISPQFGSQHWDFRALAQSRDWAADPGMVLWEAMATDRAVNGGAQPVIPSIVARGSDERLYQSTWYKMGPGFVASPLAAGEVRSGKIYFQLPPGVDITAITYREGQDAAGPQSVELTSWNPLPPQPDTGTLVGGHRRMSVPAAPAPASIAERDGHALAGVVDGGEHSGEQPVATGAPIDDTWVQNLGASAPDGAAEATTPGSHDDGGRTAGVGDSAPGQAPAVVSPTDGADSATIPPAGGDAAAVASPAGGDTDGEQPPTSGRGPEPIEPARR